MHMENAAAAAPIGWERERALYVAPLGKLTILVTVANARRMYSVG